MANRPKKQNRQWKPIRKAFGRATTNYEFYNSWKWRKLSKRFKEEHPLCVKCSKSELVVASEFTDHIVRIEDGGEPYDETNLQALCAFHHNQKSGREAHGYKETN